MILVVGYPGGWTALRRNVAEEALRFVTFAELTPRLLHDLAPSLLISPLMGEGFDAVDVAHRLEAAAFKGRFRVLSPPIPEPEAVQAEIQEAAGRIAVDLMILSHRGG